MSELVASISAASREQAQGIQHINSATSEMDKVTQSNAASAEESASAAEELDAQAASLKDMVGKLRQLVGGANTVSAAPPSPSVAHASHVTVFSNQPAPRPRPRPQPHKSIGAGQRKAIPMPGDARPAADDDDENFKNF